METCYAIERSSNLNDTTVYLIYTREDSLLKRKYVFLWFTFFTSLNAFVVAIKNMVVGFLIQNTLNTRGTADCHS